MAKCPYCKEQVTVKNIEREEGVFRKAIIYACPHCDALLSVEDK